MAGVSAEATTMASLGRSRLAAPGGDYAVAYGVEASFEVLASTRNEAAVDVLIPALDSPHRAIQEGALRALLERRSAAGRRELVRRWDVLNDRSRAIVAERSGRISGAVRDAILSAESAVCVNGCAAVLWIREYDLVPALINATEDKTNVHADLAARTLVKLTELLYRELASPRDYRRRRDPQLVRRHIVESLELSVGRFEQHKRREIVEALLMLARGDNSTVRRILQDPRGNGYLTVIETLSQSERPGVIRLLLSYLEDPQAPSAPLTVLARRSDLACLRRLLRKVGPEPSADVARNLKRLDKISWICDDRNVLLELTGEEQHAAMGLSMASGVKRLQIFEAVRLLIQEGRVEGRRAAAEALAEFSGSTANELAMMCLDDEDPQVQAAVISQLRQRGIPSAMTLLLERVESPYPEVRQAAQESLSEFNVERYLSSFDMLDDEARRNMGLLAKKVDPNGVSLLQEELTADSRTRRLRALKAAPWIRAVPDVVDEVIKLLSDSDHMVRVTAAASLRHCDTPEARQALREALLDRSVAVQEAAEETLRAYAEAAASAPASASREDRGPENAALSEQPRDNEVENAT